MPTTAIPRTHLITDWPHAVAGFTARGAYDPADPESGCNLGHTANADHAAVDARRARVLADLGVPGYQIVCGDQVHGTRVALATAASLPGLEQRHGYPYHPNSDALITAEPGLALMLFFADCCPVWLYCPDPLCGGLAHCGWRGTVADLAGLTVAALQQAFDAKPPQMRAVVGPSICGDCYEVGPEVAAAAAVQPRTAGVSPAPGSAGILPAAVSERDGCTHLDLLALNALLLERAGLLPENIRVVNSCTRCGPIPLYSYRRDGAATGRMAALFALR
jgi:polyphenol oxidase